MTPAPLTPLLHLSTRSPRWLTSLKRRPSRLFCLIPLISPRTISPVPFLHFTSFQQHFAFLYNHNKINTKPLTATTTRTPNTMALPPKFAGQKLDFAPAPSTSSAVGHTTHTLELYLDYCCPFSAKIFKNLTDTVFPSIRANSTWSSQLSFIFRQSIQPWHPSSTLMHEAALAVLRLDPEKFYDFSSTLFAAQKDFFDVAVVNETRNVTYRRLAKLAATVGVNEDKVYELLEIPTEPGKDGSLNAGNQVTNDVKLITKMNRLIGVHVTPTGVFDGVVQDLSSGWTGDQWKEWLTKNVV
ncbi:hypothetical protein G7046_g4838 [Stylonectria norvegica]|nr:hypothetical protein G7046_g4838 [Stylonectria norvegica]